MTDTPDSTAVRALLDEREIVRVCLRYATALDTRDWALLRTCFTPDAVADYDGIGQCHGYEAIEEVCRGALTPLDHSQHLLGNLEADVDGDEAAARCYLQAQHVRAGTPGGPNFVIAGVYTDRFVRTPDGWRISRRHLATWWTEGNPAVVAPA